MTAPSLLMAEEQQETFDELWTHLPYEDGRIEIGGLTYRFRMQKHIPVDPETWKPIPFDPDKESTEILIQDPNQRLFWGNVQTINFLEWYFAKNRRTGECAGGVYSKMSKQVIVKKLDVDSVGKMLEILLAEWDIDNLCALGVVDTLVEQPDANMPYNKYVTVYRDRYKNYEFRISDKDGKDQVRVELRTTDERRYGYMLFSRRYVESNFKEAQKSGRTTVEHATGKMFSPYGISLPHSIILEEINVANIRKSIDDLIDRLSVQDVFMPVLQSQ